MAETVWSCVARCQITKVMLMHILDFGMARSVGRLLTTRWHRVLWYQIKILVVYMTDLPNCLPYIGFPIKILYEVFFSVHTHYMPHKTCSPLFHYPVICVCVEDYKLWTFSLCKLLITSGVCRPVSCVLCHQISACWRTPNILRNPAGDRPDTHDICDGGVPTHTPFQIMWLSDRHNRLLTIHKSVASDNNFLNWRQ